MLTWHYNRFGHVAIWKGDIGYPANRVDSDLYFQVDIEVEAFFTNIGMDMEEVHIGDWDVCADTTYFG